MTSFEPYPNPKILKEESLIHQKKVFCFVHMSCQEFLAAFYVFYYYIFQNTDTVKFLNVFQCLHREAIKKALDSGTGHLDLFLRFLLGISLESNQKLLKDLLTCTHDTSESIRETTEYIKKKIRNDALSAERSINLFLCLLEVNDQTLYKEIEAFVTSDKGSEKKLSTAQCSAIAYMLQMSEKVLDELDLEKYNTTEEGKRRLIPAVSNCRRALLANCNLTGQYCNIMASSLQSSKSLLRELDLSNNDLMDSGVKLISDALKSLNCQLQILRLSGCMVTEEGCCYLASALRSNPSHLRELDLSYNHPGHTGVRLLSERVNDPNCKLEKLDLNHGDPGMIKPRLQKYACALTLDLNTANIQLELSEGNRRITHVKEALPYQNHPDRFEGVPQVMCREGLTGRCYWEAEWDEWARIAVTYKGISRKEGSNSMFGLYRNSWNLFCTVNGFNLWHNNTNKDIPVTSVPSKRIGVYLDWPAGTLSFYSVSDTYTLTHIHTVKNKFTEPLYAGFMVHHSVSLCQI
ncbi:putative protein NLRC3-like [Triplophysa rosa]|uniref:B30.2/SPRY domain-containing protein n=1 Tax=Triplophysa rosa TaxID=992332 RepID=A0A9W8C875_TRIRA|nr:putative protein NLRC3-like [Triplophysa rosa]